MSIVGRLHGGRRRSVPPLDTGVAAERTAMAWQRTALGLGGVSALLVHLAEHNPVAAVPGAAGLLVALGLLLATERRYERTVRAVESGDSPMGRGAIRLLAGGALAMSISALVLLVVIDV